MRDTSEKGHSDSMSLPREHIGLADQIARRLHRRYRWVDIDDLHSYAFLGLTLAARCFDPDRGIPFHRFACMKAMFLAIDEMRKDGILRRADAANRPPDATGMEIELPDPRSDRAHQQMEAREFCAELLNKLNEQDRRLLAMIYVDKLTYREIASMYQVTESAICLRHKAVLNRLRRQSAVRQLAA